MAAPRVSLQAQIAEVRREIGQRRSVYARMIATRKLRQAEADILIRNMEGVLETLLWVKEHRETILAAVASGKDAGP